MKTVVKILLLLGVVGYLVFAVVSLSSDEEKRVCVGTKIIIADSAQNSFMDTLFISSLINQTRKPIAGILLKDVEIKYIEDCLKRSPYLDSVICYYTPDNVMCVRVLTRNPILHVIPTVGESFYMDAQGHDMPTNVFALDLCLATGNIDKKYARENLLEIAKYLNTHKPWGKEIQQIHVKSPKHLELIPFTGNHVIVLGEPRDIEDKMRRLSIFYKEGLDKVGWNKYKSVDLNYANQVVCTKNK